MKPSVKRLATATAVTALALGLVACSNLPATAAAPKAEIGEIQVNPDIKLRRMVYRPAHAKGVVLFLHGFPETMYAWKPIAESLSSDYEVHAFDWPGYGQSSRPDPERFAYAPRDYAHVLADYIRASGIDRSRLVIYATDIGALPPLLAALEQPDIARQIIVGDFAPFNRPQFMYETLQGLKTKPSADVVHAAMNKNRDEILANAFFRGMSAEQRYPLPQEFRDDMAQGWGGAITSADAFYHYYSHFNRDEDDFEANMAKLKVPVKVLWGENDIYIRKEMGEEFARRTNAPLAILPKLGHYPHLQAPQQTADEVRAAFSNNSQAAGHKEVVVAGPPPEGT
ncbi:MAG TPA: alpha/beta hydrolase [Pseudoduganella sp.]